MATIMNNTAGPNMYEMQYKYNNMTYNVVDTAEVHKKLLSDPNFLNIYFEQNASNQEIVGVAQEPEGATSNFHWTNQNTKLLLQVYAENKENFRDPKIKKKTLWEKIQKEFVNKGLNVTIDALDRKMRNLKHSFKTIKNNNKKTTTGRGRIQWEWYEIMDEIFLEDRTINIGHTLSSLSTSQESTLPVTETTMEIDNGNAETNASLNVDQSDTSTFEETEFPTSEEYNNLDSQRSNNTGTNMVESNNTNLIQKKVPRSRKARELYDLRKNQLDNENKRVKAIENLRLAIEENNRIQLERNQLLEKLIEVQRDKT